MRLGWAPGLTMAGKIIPGGRPSLCLQTEALADNLLPRSSDREHGHLFHLQEIDNYWWTEKNQRQFPTLSRVNVLNRGSDQLRVQNG